MDIDKQKMWHRLADTDTTWYVQASESEREMMRDWLTSMLRERKVNITFVKADGTERTMPCTLQESVLPNRSLDAKAVKYNPDVCRVFDPERQVWRSFRWDRLKRIEFDIG